MSLGCKGIRKRTPKLVPTLTELIMSNLNKNNISGQEIVIPSLSELVLSNLNKNNLSVQ